MDGGIDLGNILAWNLAPLFLLEILWKERN